MHDCWWFGVDVERSTCRDPSECRQPFRHSQKQQASSTNFRSTTSTTSCTFIFISSLPVHYSLAGRAQHGYSCRRSLSLVAFSQFPNPIIDIARCSTSPPATDRDIQSTHYSTNTIRCERHKLITTDAEPFIRLDKCRSGSNERAYAERLQFKTTKKK